MRVLFVCRLFTGLESSMTSRQWQPTGAPAIFKMIEALDKSDHSVRFVLTCKDAQPDVACNWTERSDVELSVEGLLHTVSVLAGRARFGAIPSRLGSLFREIRQGVVLWREVRRFNPDIIYLDNANILIASTMARLRLRPVVLRLMGVYPMMRKLIDGPNLRDRLLRWAYGAPYDLVVCTLEGSGGELWLDKALSKEVPRQLFLNGVDPKPATALMDPRVADIPRDKLVISFIGKLESYKGCDDFLDGILRLTEEYGDRIHAFIVGTGTRLQILRDRIAAEDKAGVITLLDRLHHDEIFTLLRRSDVYVSLNTLGNLSNTNLEAISVGTCMIIPTSQPEVGVDIVTDKLIPEEAVVRISPENLVDNLHTALVELCENPQRRDQIRISIDTVAKKLVWTWKERIDSELSLLEQIAVGESLGERLQSGGLDIYSNPRG
jgi:glycosyltransferase involved in cell wall biosynthesis